MPGKISLDNELKLIPVTDPITGKVTYTSNIEKSFLKKTGMTIEELCKGGRITNAYGRSAPIYNGDPEDEKKKAQFYHEYIGILMQGNGLMFYEDPHREEAKMVRYDKRKKTLLQSKTPVEPKKEKKPGWWNRRKDKKLLAQKKKGTPEMERYRDFLFRKKDAEEKRQYQYAHHDEIMAEKRMLEKLKQNSDFGLGFYLNFNKDEYASNPFTDPFSREMLVNEIGNRLVLDAYAQLKTTDPDRAKDLCHRIVAAQAEAGDDPKGLLKLLSEGDKKWIQTHTDSIRDPESLRSFLQNGEKDKLRENLIQHQKSKNADILSPDLQFADATKSKPNAPVPDEKTTAAYKSLCDDARAAMARLKSIGATTTGTVPEQLMPQVKKDLAIVSFQNTIAHSFGMSQKMRSHAKSILGSLEQKMPDGKSTMYEAILKNYEDSYLGSFTSGTMKGADVEQFLAENKANDISKRAHLFGIVPRPPKEKKADAPAEQKDQLQKNEEKKNEYVMV
ncbi:MAG: hypothetical protein MJ192_02910 [Clostridia bacterium]|nr:hypothetical protein [Clostridia bacterium]